MIKNTVLFFVPLLLPLATASAKPQIFTDFYNGKAHIIDNDILDDAVSSLKVEYAGD